MFTGPGARSAAWRRIAPRRVGQVLPAVVVDREGLALASPEIYEFLETENFTYA